MNEEEKHIELIDLAIKKLTDEASRTELERLDLLINENNDSKKTYKEVIKTWNATGKVIGITDRETKDEWNRLYKAIGEVNSKSASFSIYRIAAAITLIIIGSIVSYLLFQNNEQVILATKVQSQTLDDGSIVTLNSNTTLIYGEDFNRERRVVTLKGEAFFEVENDQSKPFIIHTGGMDVTVIGTSFNVKALEKSGKSEVVVTSGVVKVSSESNAITLVAGEKGVMSRKTGKLFKLQNEDPNFQSWRTKKFEFNDTPLVEVINLLNDVYDKSLYLGNAQLQNCPITVSFQNQSFESILKVLESTLDISIEETNKGLKITGDNC